jgi:hypothetical protein
MAIEFGKTYYAKRQQILEDRNLSEEGKKAALQQVFQEAKNAHRQALADNEARVKSNREAMAGQTGSKMPQKALPQLPGTLRGEAYISDSDKAIYKLLGSIGGLLAEQRTAERLQAIAVTANSPAELQQKVEQTLVMEPAGQGALLRALPSIQTAIGTMDMADRVATGLWLNELVREAEEAEITPELTQFLTERSEERARLSKESGPLLTERITLDALWEKIKSSATEIKDSYDDPDNATEMFSGKA